MAILKKVLKWFGIIIGVLFFIGLLSAIFGDKKPNNKTSENLELSQAATLVTPEEAVAKTKEAEVIEWNIKEPDVLKNGNIKLAVEQIKSGSYVSKGSLADAANVLKAPWKYYGQTLCFNGIVGLAQDQPPGSNISKGLGGGETSEVVLETADGAIVDLFALQSSGKLNAEDSTTVCGLPVGRAEVPNAVGGNFTHLIVVGYIQK